MWALRSLVACLIAADCVLAFDLGLALHYRNLRGVLVLPSGPTLDHGNSPSVELVVNAWKEDMTWIDSMFINRIPNGRLRLYCNGPALQDQRCERIPNYGTENYAYLHHIIQNYDQLAPVTVFSLGSIMSKEWDHLKCRKLNYVLAKLDTVVEQANFPGYASMAHTAPGIFLPFEPGMDISRYRAYAGGPDVENCRPSVAPLGKFYEKFVDNDMTWPKSTGVQFNGIFAVGKELIQKWPKATYEGLLKEMTRCGEDVPLTADHYVERIWKAMLDRDGVEEKTGENQCPIADLIRESSSALS